jgi:ABC-type transport system involved in cytochrome c biogenesis ATPase subunit
MHTHLSGGGLIIAATHGPLGLGQPEELRLGTSSRGRAAKSDTGDAAAMDAQ